MVSDLLEHDFSIQRGNKDILMVFSKGRGFLPSLFCFQSKKAVTISGNTWWKTILSKGT
jgi:hypothetical protein